MKKILDAAGRWLSSLRGWTAARIPLFLRRRALEAEYRKLRDEMEFGAPTTRLNEYSLRELRAYQPRLTAFVDILGFRPLVRKMKADDEARERLLKALRSLAFRRTKQAEDVEFVTDQRVSCFSDSIVISYPFYGESDLDYLVSDVIALTADMVQLGLPVRGGIAMAELHQTPGMIVGDALIDAYELEDRGCP